ncbi:MAG TPA: hypothetical protein VEF72_26715 [Mycobacterium sp.]|nr:hypothetical protein [Mycobacterium sp.]
MDPARAWAGTDLAAQNVTHSGVYGPYPEGSTVYHPGMQLTSGGRRYSGSDGSGYAKGSP